MIDWNEAAQHVSALEIGPEDKLLLALFPPEPGAGGCIYIEVSPGSNWAPENVERELKNRPGYALGAIFNPGGKKNSEIKFCRFLVFEDDGPGGLEEKRDQWQTAGLPRPSFQVWTGGKSVHHYYLLEKTLLGSGVQAGNEAASGALQALAWSRCGQQPEQRGQDSSDGRRHPPQNWGDGQVQSVSGGQKYSLEQLWNLTGDDPYVEVSRSNPQRSGFVLRTCPPYPPAPGPGRSGRRTAGAARHGHAGVQNLCETASPK